MNIISSQEQEFHKRLTTKIKKEMRHRNMTYYDMAELLGLTYQAFRNKIAQTGRGVRRFTIYELYKISDEFLMPLDDLIRE